MPVVLSLNFHQWDLVPEGWTVVALRHYGNWTAYEHFAERIQPMRKQLRCSFAFLDVYADVTNEFALHFFPRLARYTEDTLPGARLAPQVFVFVKRRDEP